MYVGEGRVCAGARQAADRDPSIAAQASSVVVARGAFSSLALNGVVATPRARHFFFSIFSNLSIEIIKLHTCLFHFFTERKRSKRFAYLFRGVFKCV